LSKSDVFVRVTFNTRCIVEDVLNKPSDVQSHFKMAVYVTEVTDKQGQQLCEKISPMKFRSVMIVKEKVGYI